MTEPLVLYSTITRLAYHLAERHYHGRHYVWCAPIARDIVGARNPPSSDPLKLYWRLFRDVVDADTHSAAILQNKNGLKRGANAKAAAKIIDDDQRDLIHAIVDLATAKEFAPLLLIIPFRGVKAIATAVAIKDRANVTSEEYLISQLPRDHFDVLSINE